MLNETIKQSYIDNGMDKFIYMSSGIPIHFDPSWKRIGFNISGGADSAILAYTVLKHITDNNLDIEVHTISHIRCWTSRPWQRTIRLNVIQKLKEYFPTVKIVEHENFIPVELEQGVVGDIIPTDNGFVSGDKIENSSYARYIGFRAGLDAAYCATTRNPDHLGNSGGDAARSLSTDNVDFHRMVYGAFREGKFPIQMAPFTYHTKELIIRDYFVHGVEDLLDTTRSCEADTSWMYEASVEAGIDNDMVTHKFENAFMYYQPEDDLATCGKCFWCLEKEWAIKEARRSLS